ncbi:MAG: enoyl-CoA hydratase/isomerase family protein, partial [Nanoarchaeota archaeon]
NNPKKLNSFDFAMVEELGRVLDVIGKSSLKAIVITGSGRAFCSGGDISWEKEIGEMPMEQARKQMKYTQSVFAKIEQLPQVVIALINGVAIGGGNELAMACDIRVAMSTAKFFHPETKFGTVAPLGGTKRLPRLVGLGRAKYMLFTGDVIDSKKALEWGLVDFLISQKEAKNFMNSLLSKIIKNPTKSTSLTKKSVNREYAKDLKDDFEASCYLNCSRSPENKSILKEFLKKKVS